MSVTEYEYDAARVQTTLEDGTEVRITTDGKFVARINGKVIKRSSLSAIRALALATENPLPCLYPWDLRNGPTRGEIVGISGRKLRSKNDGVIPDYQRVYIFEFSAFAELEALHAQMRDLQTRYDRIVNSLTRVTVENVRRLSEEYRAKQKEQESHGEA